MFSRVHSRCAADERVVCRPRQFHWRQSFHSVVFFSDLPHGQLDRVRAHHEPQAHRNDHAARRLRNGQRIRHQLRKSLRPIDLPPLNSQPRCSAALWTRQSVLSIYATSGLRSFLLLNLAGADRGVQHKAGTAIPLRKSLNLGLASARCSLSDDVWQPSECFDNRNRFLLVTKNKRLYL